MPRRLTLVIHSLEGGGAERIAAAMANHWAQQGEQVTLITLAAAGDDRYPLDPTVTRVGLDVMRETSNPYSAVVSNLRQIKQLRRAIRTSRPHHVISLVEKNNVLTLIACAGLGLDVVICERIDPRYHPIGRIWSVLRRMTYPFCRALVVQTDAVARYAQRLAGKRPVYVVPNPVFSTAATGECRARADCLPRWVAAAGRLVAQKGFDRLLAAFGRIAERHPDWKLRIVGDGPQRQQLAKLAEQLQIADRVELLPWTNRLDELLRQSDLYVLPSRYEGFPNVLLEAMACGLPVVSFDCPSGPAEIIRDGIDGTLVPADDVAQLAAAMDRLMADETARRRMGQRAEEVVERFSSDAFFRRWEEILAAGEGTASARPHAGQSRPQD